MNTTIIILIGLVILLIIINLAAIWLTKKGLTKDENNNMIPDILEEKFAQMKNSVNLSTSPRCKPTHWKQTVFYLEKPISVKKGQVLEGHISVSRPPKDARGLLDKISIRGQSRTYDMA